MEVGVNIFAFYSDNPSSQPDKVKRFYSEKLLEKNENNSKEAEMDHFLGKSDDNTFCVQ